MASQSNGVYVQNEFSDPLTAQSNFHTQYDLENPHEAMSSYARVMHQHTKRQMESATRSARRRSPESANTIGISPQSSNESVSSSAS
ncbi:MAG: hypothetical protein M1827_000329 [Pycnora praestabilis]|nr:MAG: hypothetical protein M1827_000329 [Pycnora praestabilis]